MIKNIKNFITDNKKDLYLITFLTFFLLSISIPKLLVQYTVGIGNWDTYLYLENARNFAKMGWGDVPSIAPVLPMILSKMFLLKGHTYSEAIFNIDVVFYIIGSIAFYLLLRLKFNENTSLIGSIIYSTFTLLFSWVAIGGNDIIGVTGTILTIYLLFVSHRYNEKFYYLTMPIAAYAFLSRYTSGVMIFSIIFYWIINKIEFKEFKTIIKATIIAIISILPFLYEFYKHLGTPFPFLGQFSGTVANTVVLDSGYLPDSWYYIKHIASYLLSYVPKIATFNALVNPMKNTPSLLAYIYLGLFVIGFLLIIKTLIKTLTNNSDNITKKNKILLIITFVLFVIFLLSLGNISYIFSNVIFILALVLLWVVLKPYDLLNLDYEFVMLSLFVFYLIFQSILFTKNDRYFITVLPFIAYFITNAINEIYKYIDNKLTLKKVKLSKVLSGILIIILLLNSLAFVSAIPTETKFQDIEEACDWLSEHEKFNNSTIIYSDTWPGVSWYLNIFGQRAVPNLTDDHYEAAMSKFMLSKNSTHHAASYYIDTSNSSQDVQYPGMYRIYEKNSVVIYKNKYLKDNDINYINTTQYNNELQKEIEYFNKTSDMNV